MLSEDRERLEDVISDLFRFWMENPGELPASYQEQLEQEKPARVVCDYIAGMTDNFILREHDSRIVGQNRRR